MKHPNASRQIEVAPEAVPMYASQGWREVEPKATTKKTTAPRRQRGAAK